MRIQRSPSRLRHRPLVPWRGLVGAASVVLAVGVVGLVGPAGAGASPITRATSGHAPTPLRPHSHGPAPATARGPRATTHRTSATLGQIPRIPSRSAIAKTFVVDNAGDGATTSCAAGNSGTCTLRAAIAAAEADTGHLDAIDVPSGTKVVLSQGTLNLTTSMYIDGSGASVNGAGSEIFYVEDYPAVEISGLSIIGGHSTYGGGISCDTGALVLDHVIVTQDKAEYGGGIYSYYDCQLWVESSVVTADSALGYTYVNGSNYYYGGYGGGIDIEGSGYIERSVIDGNSASCPQGTSGGCYEDPGGAGLYADDNVVLADSSVDGNELPTEYGYGVGVYNDENLSVVDSSIDHNVASAGAEGVGLYNDDVTKVADSSISFNQNTSTTSSELDGAAVYGCGDVFDLTDVTMDGNTNHSTSDADIYGGAIYSDDETFSLDGGTIEDTSNGSPKSSEYIEGGAIDFDGYAYHADISNTVVAGTTNTGGIDEEVDGGVLASYETIDLQNVSASGTTNTGDYIEGGVFYLSYDDPAALRDVSASGTRNVVTGADEGLYGGAIYNEADLIATNLSVDGTSDVVNTTAVALPGRSTTVGETYIYGGVLYNDTDSTLDGVSFTHTSVDSGGDEGYLYGGAVYNDGYTVAHDVQVVGLDAEAYHYIFGGIWYNDSYLAATNLTLGDASVSLEGSPSGSDYLDGAIFYNDELAQVTNGTFDNISSSANAKAEYMWAIEEGYTDPSQFTNTTIANDDISGPAANTWLVWADVDSTIAFRNSIVDSDIPSWNCGVSVSVPVGSPRRQVSSTGHIISTGWNIDSGHTCGFKSVGDMSDTDPMVMPLANNGGAVWTAELTPNFYGPFRAGSPAINAGSNIGCPTTDARGVVRPQEGTCDIGAYETAAQGYWMSGLDGGLFHFGAGHFYGSVAELLAKGTIGPLQGPIEAVAPSADHLGYWQLGADGGVFGFGSAGFRGSIARLPLAAPIVGGAASGDGGYWLVGAEGRVTAFGSATYWGSEDYKLHHEQVVGMAGTPDGLGYWLVTADGNVLAFGDAVSLGSPHAAGLSLNSPLVGIAATPDGHGYWLVGSDGGIFAYGDAHFYGSMGGRTLNKPIVSIAATPDGLGYWLFASDGGVFNFGDAQFLGSLGGTSLAAPITSGASSNY